MKKYCFLALKLVANVCRHMTHTLILKVHEEVPLFYIKVLPQQTKSCISMGLLQEGFENF